MNKDQVKGAAKNTAGKVQREVGKLVGSERQQVKGAKKQIEGTAQRMVGDIKQAAKESSKKRGR